MEYQVPTLSYIRVIRAIRGLSFFAVLLTSSAAAAPRVSFDVGSSAACRDVTTPEFAKANSGERLVEARLSVSSLVQGIQPTDQLEFMIRLESPEHTASVVDYAPRTTLAGEYAGTLTVEKKEDQTRTLGGGFSAEFNHVLKLGTSGENGNKQGSTVKYELLPPLETLAAAGTFGRGHGVYFKLKPSRRTSLEGARDFQVVLRVPAAWCGDYIYLKCEATGRKAGAKDSAEPQRWGGRTFIIPLYLEGNPDARRTADEFVIAEAALRYVATAERSAMQKKSPSDSWWKFDAAFAASERKPASDWLDRLVFGPVGTSVARIEAPMSPELRSAAAEFLVAKRQMWELAR